MTATPERSSVGVADAVGAGAAVAVSELTVDRGWAVVAVVVVCGLIIGILVVVTQRPLIDQELTTRSGRETSLRTIRLTNFITNLSTLSFNLRYTF